MAEFVRAVLAAVPFRYVGGVRAMVDGEPFTTVFLEDKGAAIVAAVHFRLNAPEGQRVTMDVLVEGEPHEVAALAAEQRGQVAVPGQARFTYRDLFTGDDPVGFAGALRRLTRAAADRLAGVFGPGLEGLALPPGLPSAEAGGFRRRLRSLLRTGE